MHTKCKNIYFFLLTIFGRVYRPHCVQSVLMTSEKFFPFKSHKDMLVHSEFKNSRLIKGCVKCGDRRCKICKSMVEGEYFTSRVTGRGYVMNFRMDCNSDHVVYVLSCARCSEQYVGSTITKFRTRFNNHKSRLIAHQRLTTSDRVLDDLIYRHFNQQHHQSGRCKNTIDR